MHTVVNPEAVEANDVVANVEEAVLPILTVKFAFVVASPFVVILKVIEVILPAFNPNAVSSAPVKIVCIRYEPHLLQKDVGCEVAVVNVVPVPTVTVQLFAT